LDYFGLMFIIALNYVKPLAEIERHLADHGAFLDRHYQLGQFIFSGRKNPRTGGVILAHRVTREELAAIIAEDPFNVAGVAEYEVTEVLPTKWDKGFEGFLEK
jgi:uncharacterized protein YciI